jgi:hypothetical protein
VFFGVTIRSVADGLSIGLSGKAEDDVIEMLVLSLHKNDRGKGEKSDRWGRNDFATLSVL